MQNQCQYVDTNGQCCAKAQIGSNYCSNHAPKHDMQLYQILNQKFRERYLALQGSNTGKTLEQEKLLAVALLEKALNDAMGNPDGLPLAGITIKDMLDLVRKLKLDAQKLGVETSLYVSKETVLDIIQEVTSIFADELKEIPGWEGIMLRVSDRILPVIENASNQAK